MRTMSLATALAVALAAGPVLAQGHDDHQDKDKGRKGEDQGQPNRGQEKKQEEHAQPQQQPQQQQQEQQQRAQQQQAEQQRRTQQQQAEQQQRAVQRAQEQQQRQQQEQGRVERQRREAAPVAPVAPARAQEPRVVAPLPPPSAVQRPRLSEERQQRLIAAQQARTARYDDRLRQQLNMAEQRARTLEQQRRTAQYRFQQDYLAHLREQEVGLASLRAYDYGRDPYFYSAPAYRYYRGGQYYDINQYAADVLQQAVSFGYQEGLQAGRADREDRWRFDYRDTYAYEDALYGYRGLYVDPGDYEYYFREGFRRGYDDGYYSRYRYGVASNGSANIVASVLSGILGLRPLF